MTDKEIDRIIKANIKMAGFISLVKRMREAQKRQEYTDSTLDIEAMHKCRKLTKQRESEVDEYLKKIEQLCGQMQEMQ